MALLEVISRTYKRPALLRHNRASVELLGPDVRQVFLVDEVGLGIAASYERLSEHEPGASWVWILDDDDLCIYDQMAYDLSIIDCLNFDVVMCKMERDGFIFPDKFTWQKPPELGHICVSCFIVRRDVWMQHRHAFAPGSYSSDFNFIASVFATKPSVYWLDKIVSKTQQVSKGEPE